MTANSFGKCFVATSFGESHGPVMGVVVDGCPAGIPFDINVLIQELQRRRPGQHDSQAFADLQSSRLETDEPEILSGVFEGRTLGTPIAILVRNRDARSQDYDALKSNFRNGHADDQWQQKYGHYDHRGGGRASGRETVARVMAGAVAQMFLKTVQPEIKVVGFSRQIGPLGLDAVEYAEFQSQIMKGQSADSFAARFPSTGRSQQVQELLSQAKQQGRSYGGVAEIRVFSTGQGLGQPVFHKLKADLAGAMLGVGATAGIEFGSGFEATQQEGSSFHSDDVTAEKYGGIRGGLSTGEPITFRVAFKPTSSVLDVAKKGRHDPCIVPRAIPVLEAMTWLVLADHALWRRLDR